MSNVTGADLAHAALRRLSAAEGTAASVALLERLGIASATNIPEERIDEILAACPPLESGKGVMVAADKSKKPSTRATLNEMGADRNAKSNLNAGIAGDLKEVLGDGKPEDFDNAAKALHARNRNRAAKAK